ISGARRASRTLVEANLSRDLLAREDRLERILSEILDHSSENPRWSALDAPLSEREETLLAYECWASTELAVEGLHSAVSVLDTSGRLRSQFTDNLPPGIHRSSPAEAAGSATRTIRHDLYRLLTLQIRLLRGEGPLFAGGRLVGHLIVQISREPDNLPFFTRNDPLAATHSPAGRDPIYDEFLDGEPVVLLYSSTGEVDYSSALRPPALRGEFQRKLARQGSIWREVEVAGRPHLLYYFPAGAEIAAIGYPKPGSSAALSALVRFLLLALTLALAARACMVLVAHPRDVLFAAVPRMVGALQSSYSRRLLAALLLASMLPLIGLSAWLRAQVRERTRSGLESSA
ncbi:MAG: hypothetical protein ACRD1Z_09575, partial [Vicinamibacteria bacterium]